jgi:phosphoglycolate phosphatase
VGSEPGAVLFDLDGTLVDSYLGIAATVDAVLERSGHPPCDRVALRALIGAPLEGIFTTLVPGLNATAVSGYVAAYLELFPRLGVPASPLFSGMEATLGACRDAGLRLAVVTSKRHLVAQEVLAACGAGPYFEAVVGADDCPRPKPDPGPALLALERLGLPLPAGQRGGRVSVVGDTEFDLGMARAAGCRPIGVGWGYRPPEVLRAAGAVAIAGTPQTLLSLLLPAGAQPARRPPY